MTRAYVGPTSLTALGSVGELDLLGYLDGRLVVPEAVEREVTTEPARTALSEFLNEVDVSRAVPEGAYERATGILGVEADTHEAAMLAGVLAHAEADDRTAVGVVSEDTRVRTLTEGLGGSVTSAFGVVVRAAAEDKYLSRSQAKRIVRRMDDQGLGMTGQVREQVVGDMGE
jgi:predicted nucleic acid-binding protein